MKGKSVLKRILSFTLSAAMAVTMLPAQMASAAEGDAAEMPYSEYGSMWRTSKNFYYESPCSVTGTGRHTGSEGNLRVDMNR